MKPLKILIVEDSQMDEQLLLRELAKADYDVYSMSVKTESDMKNALTEREWDIVLSDYIMPDFTGLDALRILRESGQDIPFIIISATIGEDAAVEAIRFGVNDYLMKDNLARLALTIERELENAAKRRAQKSVEENLRLSKASLANAQRIAHIGNWDNDLKNNYIRWSDESYRIFGVSKDDFDNTREAFINFIHPDDRQMVQAAAEAALAKIAPYNVEHRIILPDGKEKFVCEIGEVTFDEAGEPIYFSGTVQDITERKKNEAEMQLMKSAVDSIVEGIIITDARKPGNPIIYVNSAFEEITGYAFEEINGQNCRFLQGPETNHQTVNEIRKAIEQQTTFRGEILNYRKNGDTFWNELSVSPVFDESGHLTNFVGAQQDISERKLAEETLQASEANFRQLVDSSIIGITITHLDGAFIEANDVFLKTVGYSREDLLAGKLRWNDMTPPEISWQDERAKKQLFDFGFSTPREKEYIRKDGSRVPVMVGGTLLKGAENTVVAFVLDISEQKRVEEDKRLLTVQIERQHERLNNIIANVPGVVWEAWGEPDAATQRIDFVSDYVETMLGYAVEEWLATPNFWLSIVHPEDKEQIARDAAENYLAGTDYIKQFRWIANDGHIVWVESHSTIIRDEAGQTIGLRGINIDITGRKQLEIERTQLLAELSSEKARLQHIFDNSPSFIVAMRGPDFVFEIANPAYYEIVGQRDLIGFPAFEALPELVSQGLPELLNKVYKTGEPFMGSEVPVSLHPRKGSAPEQHYVNFVYMPLREADNSISGIVSYGMDVTEQVLARYKLQESEERYRVVAETANDVIITIDEHSTILFVNPAVENVLGYKPSELIGNNLSIIIPERWRAAHTAGINRYIQTDKKHLQWKDLELPALHRDGREIKTETSFGEYRENSRRFFAAVMRDVTERKRAEQLIIESEEKYRSIVETANEGIWLTDIETRATYVNRQMAEMLGYTIEEMLGRPIFDFIFDDDLSATKHRVGQYLNGKSETGESRLRRKDGSELFTLYNSTPRRDQAGEIIGFLSMKSDITERKKAERKLIYAEAKYRSLVESSPAIVYLAEPHPPFSPIYISPNISRIGYTAEDWFARPDMWMNIIHEDDRAKVLRTTEDAIARNIETDLEYRINRRDGTIVWIHDKGRFVLDERGNKTGWQGLMVDITKTKQLEDQLRQAQRLESIGLLAGGIAHDFNNMLTAINGYSDLTLRKLTEDDPLRFYIAEIKKAGQRSADLTHQLLAFSRQQILQPIIININETIRDTMKMLERLIGEDIRLTTTLNPKVGLVKVDQGQLSQIIMNLAVNARDAMPQGGKLTLETSNIFLDPTYALEHVGVLPGAYVMLAVSDTGSGMSAEVKKHIFEPFFTTKEIGQGTGLGLATVHGIVQQSGGSISVYSEESVGTTFKIFLPRVAETAETVEIKDVSIEMPKGAETILLVEDEEMVRHLTRQILEECGYTVIEARNGLEALTICEQIDCKFDLLMTDVVMPVMGGSELAEKLKANSPAVKVIFTSGYTDDAVVRHGVIEAGSNFIQKPYTPEMLANKIRTVLDKSGNS